MAAISSEVLAYGAVVEARYRTGSGTNNSVYARTGYESLAAASSAALSDCRQTLANVTSRDNASVLTECTVVASFKGYCVAIAESNATGSATATAMGWDVSQREADARATALEKCNSQAGSGSSCRLKTPICDPQTDGTWLELTPIEEPVEPAAAMLGLALLAGAAYWIWTLFRRRQAAPAYGLAGGHFGVGRNPGRHGDGGSQGPTHPQVAAFTFLPLHGGGAITLDQNRLAQRGLYIGRHPDCDIVVSDPKVSTRHARLALDAAGRLVVEDLGSSNGTSVNEQKITKAALRPGDIVGFSKTKFRLG